jgi:hypothetical protein
MSEMTTSEYVHFLTEGTRTAKIMVSPWEVPESTP